MSDSSNALSPADSVDGLIQLARTRAKAGDAAGAGRTFAAALHLAETHGLWGPTARAQAWLAGVDVKNGRLPLARERLDRAWALCSTHDVSLDVRAEVAGQLGQVLVFQGHAGAGAALMVEAVRLFGTLDRTAERDELELALAAMHGRVDDAVREAEPDTEAAVRATLRRGEVQLGMGQSAAARADFATAWQTAGRIGLPSTFRGHIGLRYAGLLLAGPAAMAESARTVLQATRVDLADDEDALAEVDRLLTQLQAHADT